MAMKVLLVDDEPGIRKVLGIALADAGYEVHTAEDGTAGLDMARTLGPDIMLTDIRMPGLNGIDLLKSVKKESRDIEVIMITGHGDLGLAIESLKLDAVDFITKPINNDILEIALKRARDRISTRKKLARYTQNLEELVAEKTRKLAASEKRYVRLFNESPSYITIQDEEFRIVESNNRFREEFGGGPDICCYQAYKKREAPCPNCPVQKTFQDGKTHTAEMDVTLEDGSLRNFLIQTSPITGPDGRTRHVMEMSTDVTMIHQLQDHLATLGLHISSVSHGIKGLLTGLDGGDYLITSGLAKGDTDLIRDGWDIVRDKISKIRQMVLDILFHSKDRPLDLAPVDLFDFIQELAATMAPRLEKAGITLALDIPKPDESVDIPMDKTVLFAAFLAILENAADACTAVKTSRRKLIISIRVRFTNREILFKIRDNGKGLAREFREEVFSLFYSDKGKKGTGLGLFIAQRSVKKHNGVIRVNSVPGEFTEFTIALPSPCSII